MSAATAAVSASSPVPISRSARSRRTVRSWPRMFVFYSLAVLLTGFAALMFADLLWRLGWSNACTVLIFLFTLLFLLASVGCMHAIHGFAVRRCGDPRTITALAADLPQTIDGTSTALVFPIYNEDVSRVCAGLRAVYSSLAETGQVERFDFFILSDSTDPKCWIEEERQWFACVQSLKALGRIHYRRRLDNEDKKSGNVRDFLNKWGRRYRYFIVFDADSLMVGKTIVDLVRLMEANPSVGLIQTAPALANARSLFARMQQFANRLYGPLFTAGLNYWSQDGGNYWGHNAIIRTDPFMRYCDLPKLPGRRPFGGHILSHDFVEAALLRRENWEVWFAWDLEGSYEEGPPAVIENAQRDRRWCQGNLQHFMLLFARGFRGVSRLHLTFGIFGYLAGPLWLIFMITSTYMLWSQKHTGLSSIAVSAFTPFIRLDPTGHALFVFGLSMTVIFLPKILALLDLALDRERSRKFGGVRNATWGALVETIFSTLHAPVQMLFHTKFVLATLFGTSVRWSAQKRGADGTAWSTAFRQHGMHTAIGLGWGALVWWLDPHVFWWFAPVLCGMILSVPLSVFTSRESLGKTARSTGLLVTPEEMETPPLIGRLDEELASNCGGGERGPALAAAILDPYINALHVTLLHEKETDPLDKQILVKRALSSERARELAHRVLTSGPDALKQEEEMALLTDAGTLSWLHQQVWALPAESVAPVWTEMIQAYSR